MPQRFPSPVTDGLERIFAETHNPLRDRRQQLAEEFGLTEKQVRGWFENRRRRLVKTAATTTRIASLAQELGVSERVVKGWLREHRHLKRSSSRATCTGMVAPGGSHLARPMKHSKKLQSLSACEEGKRTASKAANRSQREVSTHVTIDVDPFSIVSSNKTSNTTSNDVLPCSSQVTESETEEAIHPSIVANATPTLSDFFTRLDQSLASLGQTLNEHLQTSKAETRKMLGAMHTQLTSQQSRLDQVAQLVGELQVKFNSLQLATPSTDRPTDLPPAMPIIFQQVSGPTTAPAVQQPYPIFYIPTPVPATATRMI